MVGESNQNVFLIQKDASSFAEFEIPEFEISRVYCILKIHMLNSALKGKNVLIKLSQISCIQRLTRLDGVLALVLK